MSTYDKLDTINDSLNDIKTAIVAKGITPSGNITTYATAIGNIQSANNTTLNVTPTTSAQNFSPTTPYTGYGSVSVSAVTSSIDANITASNIKKDVQILGVTGSYEGSGGSGIGITREVSAQGIYQIPTTSFTFSLPSNATDIGENAFYYVFQGCTGLTSLDLSSLTTVSGTNAFYQAFYGCTGLTSLDLSSLTTVSGAIAFQNAFKNCSSLTSVDLSSLTTVSGTNAFQNAFQGCTRLTSLDLSSLTTVSVQYAFYQAFYGCTSLTSVDLSSLTTISGTRGLYYTFSGCTSLTSVDLSSLPTVSDANAFDGAFKNCSSLTSLDLSSLTTVSGQYAFQNAFQGCTRLTSLDLSSLTIVSGNLAFNGAFQNCIRLTSVDLSSLTTISGSAAFQNAFVYCSSLTSLEFPSLTGISNNNQFNTMLSGVTGCVVHFPMSLKSSMSSRSDVRSGFGGINTTVLFDLGGCTTTFSLTPNSGNVIIVDGNELTGTSILLEQATTILYQLYNSSYGLYISSYLVPNTTTDSVVVDLTNINYNTITIDTGVSGLTVTANVDGVNKYTLVETGNTGVYTLNLYKNTSNSVSINYFVDGGSSYASVTGTLTFNNANITETVTMTEATDVQFTRPNLTANGTMGGESFAVGGNFSSTYKAFDSSASTYAVFYDEEDFGYITFYNPNALKVSELNLSFDEDYASITSLTVQGSDDNSNWTTLTTWNGSGSESVNCVVNSEVYYKYHRLTMVPAGDMFDAGIDLTNIGITATYRG